MIFNHTHVGRYSFIFDLNRALPFPQENGGWDFENAVWEICEEPDQTILLESPDGAVGPFREMQAWLHERTHAYRMSVVQMTVTFVSIDMTLKLPAIMVEVSAELSPVFKLYWYGSHTNGA